MKQHVILHAATTRNTQWTINELSCFHCKGCNNNVRQLCIKTFINNHTSEPNTQSSHVCKWVVCVLWEMQHRWRSDCGFTNTSKLCQCCSQRAEKKSKWVGEGKCGRKGWLPCRLVVVIPDSGTVLKHINKWRKRRRGQKENTWRWRSLFHRNSQKLHKQSHPFRVCLYITSCQIPYESTHFYLS